MAKPVVIARKANTTARPQVRLASERLILQSPPPVARAGAIAAWFEDPDVGRYLAAPLSTAERAEAAIRRTDNRNSYFFGIYAKATRQLIGYTQVHVARRHRVARTTSVIGDKAYWGGKYAIEARAAILDFLFDRCAINKVNSLVYSRNLPSIFNNKALGYSCEGILRQQERAPDGGFRDVLCFGILKDEWLARRRQGETTGSPR